MQSQYSMAFRELESNGVLDIYQKLNIAFVAYSPLDRGFLTRLRISERFSTSWP
ncbi:aldo/keto reductase [Helicobacter mastomyrinus]|uniref:Aldo/keto reductase n=1 Tax=Helicobacter mastomyrinus TaxID=287948 RepID=A0ABZ3F543_9HELI|nr:aldo/keto reductase [uncultured Helicobacter sp.]